MLKARSTTNLNLIHFMNPIPLSKLKVGKFEFSKADEAKLENINILRMPLAVKEDYPGLPIPPTGFEFMENFFSEVFAYHQANFPVKPFWYLTIRSTKVDSRAENWHTDGFSMRFPHIPEQNYVWASTAPTEFCIDKVDFPTNFDGRIHNIHTYIQTQIKDRKIITADANTIYAIDPYVIHRKPPVVNENRVFIRLSNTPIEIEDDNFTANPDIPKKIYNRIGSKICDSLKIFTG
jgi:hypothetical protein